MIFYFDHFGTVNLRFMVREINFENNIILNIQWLFSLVLFDLILWLFDPIEFDWLVVHKFLLLTFTKNFHIKNIVYLLYYHFIFIVASHNFWKYEKLF